MIDAEYKNEMARIRRYLDKWLKPLGLGYWNIITDWYQDSGNYASASFAAGTEPHGPFEAGMAFTKADWRYCEARIGWNVSQFKGRDDEYVEWVVIHELMHVFLHEMREEGLDHEERVASMLAKGIQWADGIHTSTSRKGRA